jgi:uncharacterized membrane protein YbhN (UPF0104 family)
MKKIFINIVKFITFLGIGVILLWGIFGDLGWDNLKNALRGINYFWIGLSVVFSILSQISRAIRWNMLIVQLGYKPRLFNIFLSVLFLYLVNLFLPRAGEVGRCKILSKYEKIPFSKLAGTVFAERSADFITLIILTILIISTQVNRIKQLFDVDRINNIVKAVNGTGHAGTTEIHAGLISPKNILISIGIIIAIVFVFIEIRDFLRRRKEHKGVTLKQRLIEFKNNLIEGIKTILRLKNKWYFIGHTLFIYLMWLMMFYVVFLAYEPTSKLSIYIGATTFIMGGLAMVLPIPGGIGPWHFMVILTLSVYGIDYHYGKIFALIAHSATNLIYIILGLLAYLWLITSKGSVRASKIS